MKKRLCWPLILLVLLSGCLATAPVSTQPPAMEIPSTISSSTQSIPETMPSSTVTTGLATSPTETELVQTQPLPSESSSVPTEPEIIPATTAPAQTVPVQTEPPATEAPHQHSYMTQVVEPDCTTGGYTLYACTCGSSYTAEETDPLGHAYVDTVTPPTFWNQGYTRHQCGRCGDHYTDSYCNMAPEYREAFIAEVQAATVKYINQFRLEDGSTEATVLPKLTEVAEYRATLLHDDFSHSTKVLREVLAKFEYGEYITPDGWDPSEYYYYFPGQEAISRSTCTGTADEIGRRFAENFRNSDGHWRYVGSDKYDYIAVGISYDPAGYGFYYWTCCVFVSTTDQYG